MDATPPMSLRRRVQLYVSAAVTTVVVVVGLWVGATRNPLGFLVVALAIVIFAASVVRLRRASASN